MIEAASSCWKYPLVVYCHLFLFIFVPNSLYHKYFVMFWMPPNENQTFKILENTHVCYASKWKANTQNLRKYLRFIFSQMWRCAQRSVWCSVQGINSRRYRRSNGRKFMQIFRRSLYLHIKYRLAIFIFWIFGANFYIHGMQINGK